MIGGAGVIGHPSGHPVQRFSVMTGDYSLYYRRQWYFWLNEQSRR
jgi:hypothetical protein